jgi:hypothetical protein
LAKSAIGLRFWSPMSLLPDLALMLFQEMEVEVMTFNPLSKLMGFSTTSFHWTPMWIG